MSVVENYTEKSFVVYGEETKNMKEEFMKIGGRWNPNLKSHPYKGWVFSNNNLDEVKKFLSEPVIESKAKTANSDNDDSISDNSDSDGISDTIIIRESSTDGIKNFRVTNKNKGVEYIISFFNFYYDHSNPDENQNFGYYRVFTHNGAKGSYILRGATWDGTTGDLMRLCNFIASRKIDFTKVYKIKKPSLLIYFNNIN